MWSLSRSSSVGGPFRVIVNSDRSWNVVLISKLHSQSDHHRAHQNHLQMLQMLPGHESLYYNSHTILHTCLNSVQKYLSNDFICIKNAVKQRSLGFFVIKVLSWCFCCVEKKDVLRVWGVLFMDIPKLGRTRCSLSSTVEYQLRASSGLSLQPPCCCGIITLNHSMIILRMSD